MAKKANNTTNDVKKNMAKIIIPVKTNKEGIYKFKTEILEYEKALQTAKNIK